MIHESPDGGKTIKSREMNLPNHNSSNNCDTSQTAVEWLIEELKKVHHPTEAMIMYAKKLEKQQIIDAYWEGGENMAKKYFAETYGSKGSDECYFEPTTNTSSATICKHCGKEKFLHQ